jgi:predicted component of type VI protein secretion system
MRLANSVTVLLSAAHLASAAGLDDLLRLGARLLAANPFGLYQLVIEGAEVPPLEPAVRLAEAFHNPGNYFERSRYYQEDVQGRFSARLFHLTADLDAARRHYEQPLPLDLILAYTPRLLASGRDLLEEHPLLLLERPLPADEQKAIREIYAGRTKLLIFSTPSAPGKR